MQFGGLNSYNYIVIITCLFGRDQLGNLKWLGIFALSLALQATMLSQNFLFLFVFIGKRHACCFMAEANNNISQQRHVFLGQPHVYF
jgi:hypothetical protein